MIPAMPERASMRIGADTGGTFTDLVLWDPATGRLSTHKLLSTPDDPGRAVLAGLKAILAEVGAAPPEAPESGPSIIHGSTVATNALLEGKGARAALVTTAGFEDLLHIGRQNRPELYALRVRKPDPPVDRDRCVGAAERVAHDGSVLEALSDDEVHRIAEAVRDRGAESVAVCLLHGYANPEHERRIAEALRRDADLHVTVSSDLLPVFREYERAATCAINAVVGPPMARYVGRLAEEVGERNLRVMASGGGSLPAEIVRRDAVHTILSGPAGGALGALAVARAGGADRIITFDMGGTSTDVALCDGALSRTTESEIAGLPVALDMIDIHTVGAGGGSIGWLDPGGALQVGPESTGADPGPASYGRQRGRPIPAVTDAHVVLGHLPISEPLGGTLRLDADAAGEAVGGLARAAGLDLEETALGMLRVAEATMARAIQRISVQRGHDPRRFALVPFGGAGALHACRLAELLDIARVLVPRDPGLLSAVGMLFAGPQYDFSQSVMDVVPPDEVDRTELPELPAVRSALAALREQARLALDGEAIRPDRRVLQPSLDLRYAGQSYELNVPLGEGDPVKRFVETHLRLYGYTAADKPLEVVAARLRATAEVDPPVLPRLPRREGPTPSEIVGERPVFSDGRRGPWAHAHRSDLLAGDALYGPAIVSEYSATTIVPPGWRLEVNELGQLLLERDGKEAS